MAVAGMVTLHTSKSPSLFVDFTVFLHYTTLCGSSWSKDNNSQVLIVDSHLFLPKPCAILQKPLDLRQSHCNIILAPLFCVPPFPLSTPPVRSVRTNSCRNSIAAVPIRPSYFGRMVHRKRWIECPRDMI